jgi:hypothetical protein
MSRAVRPWAASRAGAASKLTYTLQACAYFSLRFSFGTLPKFRPAGPGLQALVRLVPQSPTHGCELEIVGGSKFNAKG